MGDGGLVSVSVSIFVSVRPRVMARGTLHLTFWSTTTRSLTWVSVSGRVSGSVTVSVSVRVSVSVSVRVGVIGGYR